MRLGLIGAIPEEINLLQSNLEVAGTVVSGRRDYLSGKLWGHDVVLVFSRIGKVAAASATMTLLERFGVDHIVFTGVAGAADPALNIGDVVIADSLVQHDMDASPLPIFKRFEIPLLGETHLNADPRLTTELEAAACAYVKNGLPGIARTEIESFSLQSPRVVRGLTASGDQFIADSAHLKGLAQALPGLQCVEMEGAAVAQVCHEHGVPFGVVRIISDRADGSAHIDFPRFAASLAAPFSAGIIKSWLTRSAD